MIAALALASALGASPPPGSVSTFGVGYSESCAAWLSSPTKEAEGFTWIVGFWTGRNAGHADRGGPSTVGHSTDGWGFVGEIKKVCQGEPSTPLMGAAMRGYQDFQREGR